MATLTHPLQRWPRQHRRLAFACLAVLAVFPLVFGAIGLSLAYGLSGIAAASIGRARRLQAE